MDKLFNVISIITGIAGGIIAALFGAWDKLLSTLVILMVLDYATGIIKAIYEKRLSSEIGFKGLLKKITILVVVAMGNVIEAFMGGGTAIREIVIVFYIVNEGISILENAAVILPKMPEGLKRVLLQLRGDDNADRN